MRNNEEIINYIKEKMKENNISQNELARRVDVSKSTISRYLNLERPFPLNEAHEYAKVLHVPTLELLGIEQANSTNVVKIPILGEISCGEPILADQNIEDYKARLAESLPSGELFYLRAKGNSMFPKIEDGNLVLCRLQEDVESGEIAAVLVNSNTEATLKRVKKLDGVVLLEPINREYETIIINENNPARIIGKALEVVSQL